MPNFRAVVVFRTLTYCDLKKLEGMAILANLHPVVKTGNQGVKRISSSYRLTLLFDYKLYDRLLLVAHSNPSLMQP